MQKIWSVMMRRQPTVGAAALVLATMVLTSRVLGLVRDRLLSSRFGPEELGVYFAAFRLPNLLFELLVMGALSAAFIPVFTRLITQDKTPDAWKMTSTILNLSIIALFGVTLPLFIWAPQLSRLLAPGLNAQQLGQMTFFTRVMLVCQVGPLMIGNLFTGVLQSYNLFLTPALAPVVYNLGIIIGIMFFSTTYGLLAPVLGVVIGAILFMLIQLPLVLRVGFSYRPIFSLKTAGVREVIKLMGPRTFSLAISQIDTTVDLILASLLGARMITVFTFAQHLQQLPIGLFGATIAQAALPLLSQATAKKDTEQFKVSLLSALQQMLFLIFPATALFIVLRIPIVRLVFGTARFDWEATVLTGMTLSFFSLSLFAQGVTQLLIRGFFALYDSRVPMLVGVATILINTIMSVLFIKYYQLPIWSLGLSTSFASIIQVICLWVILSRRVGGFGLAKVFVPVFKMSLSAIVMGVALYVPLKLFDQLVFDTTRVVGLLLLSGTAGGIGFICYLFLSWVFGVSEVRTFFRLLKKIRRPQSLILEPASEIVNGNE